MERKVLTTRVFWLNYFPPIDIQHTQCPCRFRDKKNSVVTNFETDIYLYMASDCIKVPGTYGILLHVASRLAVFLEHGNVTLGITKVASVHLPSTGNLCPLHIICSLFVPARAWQMSPAERSALYTLPICPWKLLSVKE